jgi:hypothetical protein
MRLNDAAAFDADHLSPGLKARSPVGSAVSIPPVPSRAARLAMAS